MFWKVDCPDCGGSGGGTDPSTVCFSCRGTGAVEPDDDTAMCEQEDDEWGRK